MQRRNLLFTGTGWGAMMIVSHGSSRQSQIAVDRTISLESLDAWELYAQKSERIQREGSPALLLDGLALVRELILDNVGMEVELLAEQDCYPGIVFHAADPKNFELVYTVPHGSGQPDAIQYDPLFLGSNTWQIFSGPSYQGTAELPKQKWFPLRVDVIGDRAVIRVGEQRPLLVGPLAHGKRKGRIGLWTYKPAFFRNFRIGEPRPFDAPREKQKVPNGTVLEWNLQGYGAVFCEPNGVLNINRYLSPSSAPARLVRRFEAENPTEVDFHFGFSDELLLSLDQEVIFSGVNKFKGFTTTADRGCIKVDAQQLKRKIAKGDHEIIASLKVTEPFGWGLALQLQGNYIRWLPATSHP